MTESSEQRNAVSLAVLQTEVAYLKTGMGDLKASNAAQTVKLDLVLAQMSEAKGGWRTLLLIGGAASTMGAGMAWLFEHVVK